MEKISSEKIDALFRELFGATGTVTGPRTRAPTGFDAKTIREEFLNRAKAHPVTTKDKPVLLTPIKYYEKCQPEQDLLMFICLFLKYGNNIQKALRELKNSSIISRKFALYGIDTQTKGKNLRRNQMTLSRIARSFPTHTAFVAMKNKIEGILPYSSFFHQKLPLIMQHSFFPGLIPVNKFTEELRSVTLILSMEISKILKLKSKGIPFQRCNNMLICIFDDDIDTVEQLIASSAKYVDAGINNGIDDDKKLEILAKAEILVPNADGELELSATTVALVNKLEKIKECYSLTFTDAIKKLYLEEKSEEEEDAVAEE